MLDEQRDQIRTRLRGLDEEVERLRHDPTTQIPAPDDTPDELLIDKFGQIEREINGQVVATARQSPRPKPIREPAWITIPEAADILDISYPQMARWANGKHLPFVAGDPHNPWQPDQMPIDTSLGAPAPTNSRRAHQPNLHPDGGPAPTPRGDDRPLAGGVEGDGLRSAACNA